MSIERGRGRVAGLPEWDRCAVMGVVNVTPDSFSDGGPLVRHERPPSSTASTSSPRAPTWSTSAASPPAPAPPASTRTRSCAASSRSSAALAAEGVPVSVDTMRAAVAEPALAAGAALVNDVSGGLADPAMIPRRRRRRRRPSSSCTGAATATTWTRRAVYADVVTEVARRARTRAWSAVLAGGVAPDRIVLDPGLGFAKDADARPGRSWPTSTRCARSAARCWSPPPASGSSAACSPAPTAPRRPRASATPPPPPSPRSPPARAPGRSACTRSPQRRRRTGRRRLGRRSLRTADRDRDRRARARRPTRVLRRLGVRRPRPDGPGLGRRPHADEVGLRAPRLAGARRPRRGAALLRADHGEHRRTSSSSSPT